MDRAEKEREARRAAEALAHKAEGDSIESTQGTKARKQFEKEYEASLEQAKVEKAAKREELLNSLLDQGICPFTDTEGIRQVFLLDEDIDLAHVEGTEAYYDYVETMAGKGDRVQKKYVLPRFIVKAQVDDLRAHGKEVVSYFQENQARTAKLFDMPERKLQAICEQYQTRITQYGTLNPVTEEDKQAMAAAAAVSASGKKSTEGAASAGSKAAARSTKTSTMSAARQQKREAKEASRAAKAEARAAARVAKEESRAAKRAERSRLREEKLASIQQRKESKAATKAATKAAAAIASHAAADSEIAATAGMDMSATAGQEAVSPSHMDEADAAVAAATTESTAVQKSQAKKELPIVPVATVVGVAGGGGYAFKVMKERKEADEEYRQQQMKMIMGLDADDDDDDEDDYDDDEPEDFVGSIGSDFPSLMDPKKDDKPSAGSSSPPPPSPQTPPPAAPKRRFGGIKSVFSKKPGRVSDINKLIGAEGKAPEFCSVVAKSLTFGAPGRFPHLESLSAASSMTEFDLETARGLLREEADKAGLSDQDACEEFAKVVNCMIIDIIDLASSTLKEKEDKPTVDAMNIVMDFMDHSAGLFEPFLSEGVSIKPVTYCGALGKGKLEQLYATYGTAGMTSMEVTEDRIDMFRELFEIKEKRAEGLLQKKMMSSLFKMMKDPDALKDMMGGEGMEGMEEMMKAMGGMEGMEGLAGLPGMGDEELTPEQLKESVTMMRNLVESGQVSKEEMTQVKEMFKTAYGMDMEDLINNADSAEVKEQLGDDGEELIEMFKIILDATKEKK